MRIVVILCLLFCSTAYGQMISGDLKDEGRRMLTTTSFIIEGRTSGYAKYELSVDRLGNVTGVRLLETDIKSTPTKFELRNEIVKLKFAKGTYYPKFHHVVVKYTVVKPIQL